MQTTPAVQPRSPYPASAALLARNERWIPGGLASLNRRAEPCVCFARGHGGRVWDVDGNEYVDHHFGFAPYILGHNDADVNAAAIAAMTSGLSNFGAGATAEEGELAELILRCVPGAERVQLVNTGSEATAQAIRVARAATGRAHVIKMQGGYNGHHNLVAANLMTPLARLGGRARGDEYPVVPITAGTPEAERALIHPVEFNDLEAVERVARRHPIAALITEPVLQNIGVVQPEPGYLEGLRRLADAHGFLLIFDEVKTGFRAGLGGWQGVSGVTPDLATFGKALGNGFPIAALTGKARHLDLALAEDPEKRVLIAGTYNAHPVPVCAAIACLRKLMDPALDVHGRLERLGRRLQAGQEEIFRRHGVTAVVARVASASCVYFMERAPRCWADLAEGNDAVFDARYRRALLVRGVYHFPAPMKQGSLCFAHTDADIDRTLQATDDAVAALKAGRA